VSRIWLSCTSPGVRPYLYFLAILLRNFGLLDSKNILLNWPSNLLWLCTYLMKAIQKINKPMGTPQHRYLSDLCITQWNSNGRQCRPTIDQISFFVHFVAVCVRLVCGLSIPISFIKENDVARCIPKTFYLIGLPICFDFVHIWWRLFKK
jgi:hypothetical protein